MGINIWFWVIYVVCFLVWGWSSWPIANGRAIGGNIVIWILLGLLGWGVFGPPIHG